MEGMEKQYDDPLWEYALVSRLAPYVPKVREWWSGYEKHDYPGTGVFPMKGDDVPNGLMIRATNTPVRSPIKGVQVFPFVPTAYLQISGVAGGVTRMIGRLCAKGLTIEEFTVIEKHNLPSTYHQGQFVAFVPTEILNGAKELGKYVYLTVPELCALAKGEIINSVSLKVARYV